VEVFVLADTPQQEDFGGNGFLHGHKERDIQKNEAQALRGWKTTLVKG
jgi:hypothetical protein